VVETPSGADAPVEPAPHDRDLARAQGWAALADADKLATVSAALTSSVLGDVLDRAGRFHQFLPPQIRPLRDDMVVAGRAMPVIVGDVYGTPPRPFGLLTEALDQLRAGEVYLARSGRTPCAAWGEILTATARARGAVGAVIDGYHRDTAGVLHQRWPVFSWGAYGQDAGARGAVLDYRVPVTIGQVVVSPGDLLVGDVDGVVVIPHDTEDEILAAATAKRSTERGVIESVRSGMSSTEALATYGVL
jgi:regulator of RNase E activity RraA